MVLESGMQTAETYAELFVEEPVLTRVINDLDLHVSPHQLLEHVTVSPVTNTSILGVSVTWKDAETSAVGELIRDEVERPALVRCHRHRHRRSSPDRPLAAASATHREPLFPVEPE